jgi:hypothetical protein
MQTITTIGLDIAKSVFQVHGVECCRPGGDSSAVEASLCRGVFPETAALSCRYRSLRLITLLVARATGIAMMRIPPRPYAGRVAKRPMSAPVITVLIDRGCLLV